MTTGEVFVQMFACCMAETGRGNTSSSAAQRNRRPRIDRSMIGNPTDFRHTAHIGSADFLSMSTTSTSALQRQMCSKGDFEAPSVTVPHIINARSIDEVRRK